MEIKISHNYKKFKTKKMNNKNLISAVALVLTVQLSAQTNAFKKTTWKIESTSTDGKTILKKAKKLNLPYEQSKFHYIQFEEDKYDTGTFCFGMNGSYHVSENNTIEFSEGTAGMSSDCEEPKSLIGNYSFVVKQGSIELTPIPKTDNEENYETQTTDVEAESAVDLTVEAAIEAAKTAVAEAEKHQKKSQKKSKKK